MGRIIWAGLVVLLALVENRAAFAKDLSATAPAEITALQQRLTEAGCYKGAVDGAAGAATAAAIKDCPDQEPVLRIETGMHVGIVKRIGVDRACRLAVTGSDDKTVRVWSLPDGALQRTVRLPIGQGSSGKVYAVALSPDGRTAAAGGWDAYDDNHRAMAVTLFDPTTGGSLRRLGLFDNVIFHLVFSPDGRRLGVALGEGNGIRVLDVATGREVMADKDFADSSYGLAFGPDGSLYATGDDGFLRRYDPQLKRTLKIKTQAPHPNGVAVDRTGTRLAVGNLDARGPDIFDAATLRLTGRGAIGDVGDGNLGSVAWMSDGRLVAGGQFSKSVDGDFIHVAKTFDASGRAVGADAALSANSVLDLEPCGSAIAFATADPVFGLLQEDGAVKILNRGRTADMRYKRGAALALSEDGAKVSFGLGKGGKRPVLFDLDAGAIRDGTGVDLHKADVSGLQVDDWLDTTSPKLNGKAIVLDQYEIARSLADRPDRTGFVLGADYSLRRFDRNGTQRWRQAVPATPFGLNLARDGALIAGAYGDGTIRWHRWSDGRELLALFVDAPTKRFVAWTPTGYYMASPGADDLIGWHINRGWDQTADFFPASRFREKFNRPDIVRLVLKTLDEDTAVTQADAETHRRADVKPLIAKLPPVLRIVSPAAGSGFSTGDVVVGYVLRSPSGLPVDRVDVLVDGVRQQNRGFDRLAQPGNGESQGSVAIHLPARDVEVALVAHAGDLAGEPARVKLVFAGTATRDADVLKPKLYALVVGVSDYVDPSLRLGYAAKDASDFGKALAGQRGGLYGEVEEKVILDRDATRLNLIHGLKWLEKQVTSHDVGIVFLAGHGMPDTHDRYWFLSADATPEDLDGSALSQEDIKHTLDDLAGKAILFLDSCHAGQIAADGVKHRGTLDINKVVGDFAAADNGVVVFASSTGREVSQERDTWGNGAFTKALIEGLSGKADLLHHGTITLSALDVFVADRVKELTDGDQHPVMTKPSTVPDYPIALARQ